MNMFYKLSKVGISPQVIKSLAVSLTLVLLSACGVTSGDNGEPLHTESINKLPSVNAGPDQTATELSTITT